MELQQGVCGEGRGQELADNQARNKNLWSSADLHGRWLNVCFMVLSEVWGINFYLQQVGTQEEVDVTSRECEEGTGGHGR